MVLYPWMNSKCFAYVHTNTWSTPQWFVQPRYTLQGTTCDQSIIAFSVYLPGCHFKAEYTTGTFWVQIVPRDSRYRNLGIWTELYPWCLGYESNASTTHGSSSPDSCTIILDHTNLWVVSTEWGWTWTCQPRDTTDGTSRKTHTATGRKAGVPNLHCCLKCTCNCPETTVTRNCIRFLGIPVE